MSPPGHLKLASLSKRHRVIVAAVLGPLPDRFRQEAPGPPVKTVSVSSKTPV